MQESFPFHLCTRVNDREPDVRDSDSLFLCVLWDKHFPEQLRILQLHPYTAIDCDEPDRLLYGWVDKSGNVYDHQTRPVHDDDEVVIVWQRLLEEFEDLRDWLGA